MPSQPPSLPSSTIAVELRDAALLLRQQADTVERTIRDLYAYDRDDVWRGGKATAFRAGFEDVAAALTEPTTGASFELRDAARRIDMRADEIEAAAQRVTLAQAAVTAPGPS